MGTGGENSILSGCFGGKVGNIVMRDDSPCIHYSFCVCSFWSFLTLDGSFEYNLQAENFQFLCTWYLLCTFFSSLRGMYIIFWNSFFKAVSGHGNDEHKEWRPAEATLFCIRAISNYVSVVESEVMPQVWLGLTSL